MAGDNLTTKEVGQIFGNIGGIIGAVVGYFTLVSHWHPLITQYFALTDTPMANFLTFALDLTLLDVSWRAGDAISRIVCCVPIDLIGEEEDKNKKTDVNVFTVLSGVGTIAGWAVGLVAAIIAIRALNPHLNQYFAQQYSSHFWAAVIGFGAKMYVFSVLTDNGAVVGRFIGKLPLYITVAGILGALCVKFNHERNARNTERYRDAAHAEAALQEVIRERDYQIAIAPPPPVAVLPERPDNVSTNAVSGSTKPLAFFNRPQGSVSTQENKPAQAADKKPSRHSIEFSLPAANSGASSSAQVSEEPRRDSLELNFG